MTRPVPQGFSWSASRAGAFRDCPRAYYFQYYLANGRAIEAAPDDVAEAARLKQLTSLPMWIGSKVHDTLERMLRIALEGAVPDTERVLQEMVAGMRRDYAQSHRDEARLTGNIKGACRFHEHEYAREVPRETWAERVELARTMIRRAVDAGYVERVRALGRDKVRALENLEEWTLDGVRIFVKIDLAYQDEAGVVNILDWKTGAWERGENPLQMMNYALFAIRRFKLGLDRLSVREVYLQKEDPERSCVLDPAALEAAEAQIRASFGSMLDALDDPARDAARAANLPAVPDRRRCPSCNYLKLCHEGRE